MATKFTFIRATREAGAPAPHRRQEPAGTLAALALAVAVAVSAAALVGCADAAPRAQDAVRAAPPGRAVFTGEYANGLPVYRLPRVEVVASRKAELAKTVAEEQERCAANAPVGTTVAGRVYRQDGGETSLPRVL